MSQIEGEELRNRCYPIQEDMALQTRLWRLERVGWGVFFLVVVMTLLGLFSSGVLSETTASSLDGKLSASYERFERNGAASSFRIHLADAGSDQVVVRIDGDFLARFTIESLRPEPLGSRSRGDGLELQYQPDSRGAVDIHLSLRPEAVGLAKIQLSAGSSVVDIHQFVYP
jgi:hypothetical protein